MALVSWIGWWELQWRSWTGNSTASQLLTVLIALRKPSLSSKSPLMASTPVFRIPNGIVSFLYRTGAMCVPLSNGIGVKRLQQGLKRERVWCKWRTRRVFTHCRTQRTGAIEDGLKIWAGRMSKALLGSQFFIKSCHVSKVSEENPRLNCVCWLVELFRSGVIQAICIKHNVNNRQK